MKIEPDGKQVMTFGGDGTISAVDPTTATRRTRRRRTNAIQKTTDGGQTWSAAAPPEDTYQFVNPFVMDPADANHLLTAGNQVHETTDGAGTWTTVFDLGTRTRPGDPAAAGAAGDPDNVVSAVDVRGTGTAAPATGRATPNFTFSGGPTAPGGGTDAPGTYVDRPFTIAAGESNRSATITVTWENGAFDWDLVVFRVQGAELVEAGSSAQGPPTNVERVVLARPAPGDYVIRVRNYAASGTFSRRGDVRAGRRGRHRGRRQRWVRRLLRLLRRRSTRSRSPTASPPTCGQTARSAVPARPTAGASPPASGLPKRYITSVQIDPTDARTVYVTLAGYSRRWLRPGALGPDEGADVGDGHVFKSTDAGDTFTDISGNLPDIPADFTLVRNGQLVVATDLGVFISAGTSGGTYEPLGTGLPAVPVFSLELKPGDSNLTDRRHAGAGRVLLPVHGSGQTPAATSPRWPRRRHGPGDAGPPTTPPATRAPGRAATGRSPAPPAARCRRRRVAAPVAGCGSGSRARSRGRSPSTCSASRRARG